jgi:hypothetical protein
MRELIDRIWSAPIEQAVGVCFIAVWAIAFFIGLIREAWRK